MVIPITDQIRVSFVVILRSRVIDLITTLRVDSLAWNMPSNISPPVHSIVHHASSGLESPGRCSRPKVCDQPPRLRRLWLSFRRRLHSACYPELSRFH